MVLFPVYSVRLKSLPHISSQVTLVTLLFMCFNIQYFASCQMSTAERHKLRDIARDMFYHGYNGYMKYAFPADELMPLSCKGRFRDVEINRGDLDDALGNFSLTLIDSLDTLVIMGDLQEFESAVKKVVQTVTFDSDIVVSVFEVNIRVLGGLISAHVLANYVKEKSPPMFSWYNDQLLTLATDLGNRLLPAFNTTTGLPHPRINLKHGMDSPKIQTVGETCSACAGTMILEFGALSRLTSNPSYEIAARKAMDYLWRNRNRSSDLIGTIVNIHNGDWVRRDSGVGAGVDSYYEYLLKAYILFGDDLYLKRFNRHYAGIMKYVSQGPLLVDVHMHRPTAMAKGFMDSLLAFWPGLQVLKGDLVPAVETHEFLYQVIQQHNYLMPEAFSINDFAVHWSMSLMRPEFIESTYFLYKSTGDPHYLEVGKKVMNAIEHFSRTSCGWAAVKDVRTGSQEDRMDSFVLAETFKYLFLLFADESDLVLNLDNFIFTTEAHLFPLSLAVTSVNLNSNETNQLNSTTDGKVEQANVTKKKVASASNTIGSLLEADGDDADAPLKLLQSCPSNKYLMNNSYSNFKSFSEVRESLKGFVDSTKMNGSPYVNSQRYSTCPSHIRHYKAKRRKVAKITAEEFSASNPEHLEAVRRMGITPILLSNGRIQLIQSTASAASDEDAEDGIQFMQDIIDLSRQQASKLQDAMKSVQFTLPKTGVKISLPAGPALFGIDLNSKSVPVTGKVLQVEPFDACNELFSEETLFNLKGKIALASRGDCMFVQKARNVQKLGAIGLIVVDNNEKSSANSAHVFSMSGDGTNDVNIPSLFLYGQEAIILLDAVKELPQLDISMVPAASSEPQSKEPSGDTATSSHTQQQLDTSSRSDAVKDDQTTSSGEANEQGKGSWQVTSAKSTPPEQTVSEDSISKSPDEFYQSSMAYVKRILMDTITDEESLTSIAEQVRQIRSHLKTFNSLREKLSDSSTAKEIIGEYEANAATLLKLTEEKLGLEMLKSSLVNGVFDLFNQNGLNSDSEKNSQTFTPPDFKFSESKCPNPSSSLSMFTEFITSKVSHRRNSSN